VSNVRDLLPLVAEGKIEAPQSTYGMATEAIFHSQVTFRDDRGVTITLPAGLEVTTED
jgi:hypothetical protein